jgi:hypothetical protein
MNRRVREALVLLARPSNVWLAARTLGWMCMLPLLKRLMPLPRLVRLMSLPPRRRRAEAAEVQRTVHLVDRICRVRGGNCLERSLILYRCLTRAGAKPRLVAGIGKSSDEFVGHAWVTVAGEPLLDSPRALEPYARLLAFGPDGTREAEHLGEGS